MGSSENAQESGEENFVWSPEGETGVKNAALLPIGRTTLHWEQGETLGKGVIRE